MPKRIQFSNLFQFTYKGKRDVQAAWRVTFPRYFPEGANVEESLVKHYSGATLAGASITRKAAESTARSTIASLVGSTPRFHSPCQELRYARSFGFSSFAELVADRQAKRDTLFDCAEIEIIDL